MIRRLACVALACGLLAAPAAAQSLGELARQEEARRATAKKAVKALTNADLAPSEIAIPTTPSPVAAPADVAPAAATPAAPCDPAVSPDKCASAAAPDADAKADPAPVQREEDWRRSADELRRLLNKARSEYDLVAASAEDPARSPGERAATARVAAQQLRAIEALERRWERLEQQAEGVKVPREWLDPRPMLTTRTPQ